MKREENRRWELTEAHYDLPIHTIDPNGRRYGVGRRRSIGEAK